MLARGTSGAKVIFVIDNLDISGAEKVAISLLRNSDHFRAVKVSGLVCMDDRIGCDDVATNLRHLTPDLPPDGTLGARIKKAIVSAYRLARLAKDADLVIPVTPAAAVIARAACLFQSRKVVPWVHYDRDGIVRDKARKGRKLRDLLQRMLYIVFVPSFSRLIFVSESCRRSFCARRRGGSAPRGWIVLPNPFDEESFLPTSPSRTFGAARALRDTGKPLLLFLGRIFRQKRWEDAIAVAERLAAAGFECNLAFVGDGIELEDFFDLLQHSPHRNRIHYLGPDSNARLTLQLSDALILTSLFEAWPTVILEAFAAGVPVFSYDCPSGPSEMLAGRGIVTSESPEEMARRIISYFGSAEEERKRSRAEAKTFADSFRAQNVIPVWELALLELAVVQSSR